MNAIVTKTALDAGEFKDSPALQWARLYHILELAFAHPGEEAVVFFQSQQTQAALQAALLGLGDRSAATAGAAFGSALSGRQHKEVEAEYIALFAAGFPVIPCPPYGSLYIVDEHKRLEEMLAIKEFYTSVGIDISKSYDDLPDHICVELELMHVLCFREHDAVGANDAQAAAQARAAQRSFLTRFLVPFVERMAKISTAIAPENAYTHLIEIARRVVTLHLGQFAADEPPVSVKDLQP